MSAHKPSLPNKVPRLDLRELANPLVAHEQSTHREHMGASNWPEKWPMLGWPTEAMSRNSSSSATGSRSQEMLPTGVVRPHGWGLMLTALDECMQQLLCEEDPAVAAGCVVGVLPHVLSGAQSMLDQMNAPSSSVLTTSTCNGSSFAASVQQNAPYESFATSEEALADRIAQEVAALKQPPRRRATLERPPSQDREHAGKRYDVGRPIREPKVPKPSSGTREYGDLQSDASRILREPKLPKSISGVPEYGDLLRRPGSAKKSPNDMLLLSGTAAEPWTRTNGRREPATASSPLHEGPKGAASVIRGSLSILRNYPDIIPIVSPSVTPSTSARDVLDARFGHTPEKKWDSARRARQTERQRAMVSPLRTKSPEDSANGLASSPSQRLGGMPQSIRRSESLDLLTEDAAGHLRRRPASAKRRFPGAPVAAPGDALLDVRGQMPRERMERNILPVAPTPTNVELSGELRRYPFYSEQRRNVGRPRLRPSAATTSSPQLQQLPQPALLSDMPLPFKLPP